MENYQRLEVLGEGTYGTVFKGRHIPSGKMVALKKTIMEKGDEGIPPTAIREVALLRSLDSPYVVNLEDVHYISEDSPEGPVLFLVFEYLDFDLRQFMRAKYGKGKGIGTTLARRFLYQILQGIQYCHANGVMHRDLKPANLLVDMKSSAIKIADFGLGRVTDIPVLQYSTEVITLWYRAPEILLSSDQYSCKVDVWSVGCIFAELLTGKAIFDGKWQIHTLFKIFEKLGTPTEESWPGVTSLPEWHVYPTWEAKPMKDIADWPKNIGRKALALLKGMLELDPAKRISAEEALKSPYFDGFRNNNSAPGEIDSSPVSENSTPGARGAGSSAGSSSRKRRNKKK